MMADTPAFVDIYGDVVKENHTSLAAGLPAAAETRTVIHLSLCDSIPAHGPIHSMAFALTKNGVCELSCRNEQQLRLLRLGSFDSRTRHGDRPWQTWRLHIVPGESYMITFSVSISSLRLLIT